MSETAPLVPDRLATSRIIDLASPTGEIDWLHEMAGPAARLNRFAGQIPDLQYSVAEHEVIGGLTIYAEGMTESKKIELGPERRQAIRTVMLASIAFVLHDQHETLGGDVKRPFADLCELLAAQSGLAPGGTFRKIVDHAKAHLDAEIYKQAGLPWPLPFAVQHLVSAMDERMAAEEMRRFWPTLDIPLHYRSLKRIPLAVWPMEHAPTAWHWPRAQAEWMTLFTRLTAELAEA